MRGTRVAIGLFFFADGLLLGSWAARIPAVQAHAGLSNARLGLALFASSLGALAAMPLAGWLSERVGSRRVVMFALVVASVSLVFASLATDVVGVALALFAFGAGFGSVNVSANAQGIALERAYGRPILSSFHAAFSVGGLAGAGLGAVAAGAGLAPRVHFAALAVTVTLAALAAVRRLLPRDSTEARQQRLARPSRALLILGAAAFCTLLAEGSAADWSAAYLSQSVGVSAAVAALGYTAFSLAMATSRTLGDQLNRRFGPLALARAGGGVAAIGLAAGLATGSAPVALAGFTAMGAGLGVVVPILFRAAGSIPGISASIGVATVSTIGWLGFLAGPPAIGFAAGAVGLRTALALVVLAILTLVILTRGAAPSARQPDGDAPSGGRLRDRADDHVVVGSPS
jgi:Na+/melibiose symporter-like transporter